MNACIRFILNLRRDDHVSHHYKVLVWLSADVRRPYLTYCFLYSTIKTGTSSYLASNFHPYICPHDHIRASSLDLVIPPCRTASFQRSFQYVGATMWNSLPDIIRNADWLSAFSSYATCGSERTNERECLIYTLQLVSLLSLAIFSFLSFLLFPSLLVSVWLPRS